MLILSFTRISPTHHRFQYRRDDGTGESIELESKSFLIHDFIHFCIETEAKLEGGFYGLLARGHSYADLSKTDTESDDGLDIERVTGPFTMLTKGEGTPKDAMSGLQNLYDAYQRDVPTWLTEELLTRSLDRYHRLMGAWNSLAFGDTLTLEF